MPTSLAKRCLPLVLLAACDPTWGASVKVRDPSDRPVEQAAVALKCPDGSKARVSGLGSRFPVDCDVVISKPGFKAHTIAYRELCPSGPDKCDRVFERDLVLQPEEATPPAPAPAQAP
jgi:hypothetical protein